MINPSGLQLDTLPWLPLDARSAFPRQPAIYFAIDSKDSVQYIGRSIDPRQRWSQHHCYEQLSDMSGVRIAYLFVDADLLTSVETALIEWFDPPLNVLGKPENTASGLDVLGGSGNHVSKVAELRTAKNLTQRQLADLVGVDPSTIRNWERDRGGIETWVKIARLCGVLECDISELFAIEDPVDGGTDDAQPA
ncbi:MAG: helix-turn-helix domain-containing protein [Cyanobacteria bacterium J06635_11]